MSSTDGKTGPVGPQTETRALGSTAGPALCLLGKVPRPGFAKASLSPPLQPEEASALYGAWLRRLVAPMPGVATFFHGYPANAASVLRHFAGPGVELLPAEGQDRAARLDAAFTDAFRRGHSPVAVRGTDAPDVGAAEVAACLQLARPGRLVIGPDRAVGYWCLALTAPCAALWSPGTHDPGTRSGLEARAAALGLEVVHGPDASRVDTFADLLMLWRQRGEDGTRMVRGAVAPAD